MCVRVRTRVRLWGQIKFLSLRAEMKIPHLIEYSRQSEPTAGENVMSKKRGRRCGKSATQKPPKKEAWEVIRLAGSAGEWPVKARRCPGPQTSNHENFQRQHSDCELKGPPTYWNQKKVPTVDPRVPLRLSMVLRDLKPGLGTANPPYLHPVNDQPQVLG